MMNKSMILLLIIITSALFSACSMPLNNSGNGGGNSSSASSSSAPSGYQHPSIWTDTNTNISGAVIIYMGAACNLQMYALTNINQTFTTGFSYSNKIFIYIDATVDECFPGLGQAGRAIHDKPYKG